MAADALFKRAWSCGLSSREIRFFNRVARAVLPSGRRLCLGRLEPREPAGDLGFGLFDPGQDLGGPGAVEVLAHLGNRRCGGRSGDSGRSEQRAPTVTTPIATFLAVGMILIMSGFLLSAKPPVRVLPQLSPSHMCDG